MTIQVDVDLLLEAYSGLHAYGKEATKDTQEKLKQLIMRAGAKEETERTLRELHDI